mmetsp:Transcript_57938/g.160067  ORF Transcript_57938/g.160067 Transcript_57938/m.160067 type:complete len:459 (+) Transcript_57938:1258-2634(+)
MTSDMGVELQQYYAHSMDDIRIQRPVDTAEMEEEMKQKMKADMLELIVERIVDLRPQLYEAFCSLDPQNAGLVTRMEWAKVMQNTTDPGLPFLALQPDLCDVDADGNVDYSAFLERYVVTFTSMNGAEVENWADGVIDEICRKLYTAMGTQSVKEAFAVVDADSSGAIDQAEFAAIIQQLDIGLSDVQVGELMRGLDQNKDQKVDLGEFADRFEVVFDALTLESDSSHFAQLKELGTRLWKMKGGIDAAFQKLSEPGEEGIPYNMFGKLLTMAGIEVDEEMALALAETCDLSKSGRVRSDDLKQNIKIIDRSGSSKRNLDTQIGKGASIGRRASAIIGISLSAAAGAATAAAKLKGVAAEKRAKVGWQDGIIHQIKNVIFQHRTELGAIFRDFDNDNSGSIDADEFLEGFRSINRVLEQALTDEQIISIMNVLDRDGDGNVSYEEFLGGLKAVDQGSA